MEKTKWVKGGGKYKGDFMIWREDRYKSVLMQYESSQRLLEIWRSAYEEDYPLRVRPFGFVTNHDLRRISSAIGVNEGSIVLDVGCGTGGAGLWIAEQTRARLIGIDVVSEAVEIAATKCSQFQLKYDPRFLIQSVCALSFPDLSVDAVMSIDCLWMVLDKPLAFSELSRVSKLGAKIALTTWVPKYLDLDMVLEGVGLKVLTNEETPKWRQRQLSVYGGIIARKRELEQELGRDAIGVLLDEAFNAVRDLEHSTRRFIVAEKIKTI
jgi:ubiquinone/menaquinone biosynthesis C-methylase UbiE